jgi:hypothetical protein
MSASSSASLLEVSGCGSLSSCQNGCGRRPRGPFSSSLDRLAESSPTCCSRLTMRVSSARVYCLRVCLDKVTGQLFSPPLSSGSTRLRSLARRFGIYTFFLPILACSTARLKAVTPSTAKDGANTLCISRCIYIATRLDTPLFLKYVLHGNCSSTEV